MTWTKIKYLHSSDYLSSDYYSEYLLVKIRYFYIDREDLFSTYNNHFRYRLFSLLDPKPDWPKKHITRERTSTRSYFGWWIRLTASLHIFCLLNLKTLRFSFQMSGATLTRDISTNKPALNIWVTVFHNE